MAAAYERIHHAILEQIRAGRLQPGEKLPSERDLAQKHGVSLMTSRHALAMLHQQGYVIRRVGSGTYVAPKALGSQKLQDPHEWYGVKLICRLHAASMLPPDGARPEPLRTVSCGIATRAWSNGTQRMIEEQVWLPAETEKELRQLGNAPLLLSLTAEGLFAHEMIDAVQVRGAAALRITQTFFDQAQHPVAHRVAICHSDKIRFERIIHR